jgi:amidase
MDPFASALEQAAALRSRLVSGRELVEMYLGRIERLDPRLNSLWLVTAELALEQADGPGSGPLAGVPTTVKELAPMAGFPWTVGSRAFENQVGPADHFAVSQIRKAGCPILGRTTIPELGSRPVTEFGLHGTGRNPWNVGHACGGSSGGAAAALAAGLCAWSHASDGGGSIRIPASCCGLVGLKPSRGRISSGPLVGEGWAGLSTQGAVTRTVEDAAAALDTLAGHLPGDPYWAEPEGSYLDLARRRVPRLRIALDDGSRHGVHPEIVAETRRAARELEGAGHHLQEGGPDTAPFRRLFEVIFTAGVASYSLGDPARLDPLNAAMLELAAGISAADYVRAVNAVRAHSRAVVSFWDGHDLLVTPTLTQPPYQHGHFGGDPRRAMASALDWLTYTYPYNCTGQPSITLPVGVSAGGLPLGVQLVGRPAGEAVLLQVAAELELAMPWSGGRPPDFALGPRRRREGEGAGRPGGHPAHPGDRDRGRLQLAGRGDRWRGRARPVRRLGRARHRGALPGGVPGGLRGARCRRCPGDPGEPGSPRLRRARDGCPGRGHGLAGEPRR